MKTETAAKLATNWSGVRLPAKGRVEVKCSPDGRLGFYHIAPDGTVVTQHSIDIGASDGARARAHFIGFVANTLGIDLDKPQRAVWYNGTIYEGTAVFKQSRVEFKSKYKTYNHVFTRKLSLREIGNWRLCQAANGASANDA